MRNVILCVLYGLTCRTFAFLPSPESTNGRQDYTHASITESAIYQAAAKYLNTYIHPGKYNDTRPSDAVSDFFGNEKKGLDHFAETVQDFVKQNNLAQRSYSDIASRTMNGEQIVAGNLLLQSLRENIISESQSTNPHWDAVREMIGEYLFTLQMFYSNTNWVEMYGNRSCKELGIKGKKLKPVAPEWMVTCISCNYSKQAVLDYSCADNMRNDGSYLTSGYLSYQHITKPIAHFPKDKGKCSHGGPYDTSKDLPATGGINKETSDPVLSPHYDLHQAAGQAATQATIDFLLGNGTGLLDIIGPDNFKELLGLEYHNPCYNCLHPSLSVVFVIDDTGSMSDEIFQTRQYSISIVNQALQLGPQGPYNYVLSTFNDPNTTVRTTRNGNELINWAKELKAHGGGDCPEMAMTGILNAIKVARPGSCVFFFTDADPKDPKLMDDVITLSNSKNMHLVFFLRGQCARKKRSTFTPPGDIKCIPNTKAKRRKRGSGYSLFDKLASATGSSVVHVTSSTLGSTLGKLVKENMGVFSLEIDSCMLKNTSYNIPVDPDLSLLTIKVEGISSPDKVELIRPNGQPQTFSGDSTKDDIGRQTVVLSVKNPTEGTWQIKKKESPDWTVAITGSGNIDFTYKFLETFHGMKYPISGTSPTSGSNIIVSVKVTGMDTSSKIKAILFREEGGRILKSLPVNDSSSLPERTLYTNVQTPTQPFYISILGNSGGYTLKREKSTLVIPVSGKLEILPLYGQLVFGRKTDVSVKITNTGSRTQTFAIVPHDTANFLVDSTTKSVRISEHSSQVIKLTLVPKDVQKLTTLSVELKLGSVIIQTQRKSLMVAAISPPEIKVLNKSSNCVEYNMNYYNCSHQQWTVHFLTTFSVNMTHLSATPVSRDIKFIFEQDSTDSLQYNASLRGTCCSSKSTIMAVDTASNIIQHTFDFSGGHMFNTTDVDIDLVNKANPIVQKETEQNEQYEDNKSRSLLPIIAGTSAGVAAVTLATSAIAIKKYLSSQSTTVDSFSTFNTKSQDRNGRMKFSGFQ